MTNAAIGYGTKFALETSPGTFLFEDFEEVFDVTPPTVSVDSVDVTAIGYDNRSRAYAQGLTDNGTVTAQANYIAGGSTDVRVRGLLVSGDEVYCRIVFPNGTKVVFLVVVEGYEQSVSVDDKMVSTITLKVNGDVNLLDADDEEINLPPSTGASAISQAPFLPITGGTMRGMLTLYDNPSLPMHAATKSYVDDVFANAGGSGGGVTLSNLPALPLGNSASAGAAVTASRYDHVHPFPTPAQIGAATSASLSATNNTVSVLSGRVSANENQISNLNQSVSVLTNRTAINEAAIDYLRSTKADKTYVDEKDILIHERIDDFSDYVDQQDSNLSVRIDGLQSTKADKTTVNAINNRLTTAESDIDSLESTVAGKADVTALNGFLPLSGGTMTGAIVLPSDPVSANQAATKQYVDSVSATAGSNLLNTWNTWTNGNKFNRTVEFGAYGLLENLYGGCRLSNYSTVAKTDGTYITRLRLVTGNETTKPALYFYTYDESVADTSPENPVPMFFVEGSKTPSHAGFFNGATCYKNIKINNGLAVDLANYAAQEGANLHTPLYGFYGNNTNTALSNYSFNDFFGGLHTRGYTLCNFGANNTLWPNSVAFLRGASVLLDGTTYKLSSSVKASGLVFDSAGKVKYLRSSASSAGDIEDNTWAAVTDQSDSAEVVTKGYLDSRFSSDLKTPQSTGTTNTNSTSMIAASQSGCTIQNGVGVGLIGASGACEISTPTSGQTTAFNTILSCAQSKTSGTSRHCAVLGSQGVDVQNKTTGGIYYGYVANATASPSNIQFSVAGAGVCTASDFVTANSADYAEFFENKFLGEIPLGSIVTLDSDKVRLAESGEMIVGVVTAGQTKVKNSGQTMFTGTPALIGADTPHTWAHRYLVGDFGERLYELTEDGNVQPVVNPEYDPSIPNIPRSERPREWSCVGLIGQVHVRVDSTVTAGCFVCAESGIGTKSKDKTNLYCMKVKKQYNIDNGFGVALCLLK